MSAHIIYTGLSIYEYILLVDVVIAHVHNPLGLLSGTIGHRGRRDWIVWEGLCGATIRTGGAATAVWLWVY